MKNAICALWAFAVALFSAPPMREFRIGYIGLLQAKSGTITAGGGSNAELENAVAQSDPKVATLGQTAIDALAESALEKVVVLNTGNRKVRVLAAGTDQGALTAAATTGNMDLIATFVKDDETKSSSPMTITKAGLNAALESALEDIVESQKPALSVASLIAKIEDAAAEEGSNSINGELLIIVDQVTGNLRVYSGEDPGDVAAADAAIAAAFVEEAIFTQTVTVGNTAEKPFGE